MIRILLAEDHAILRDGLKMMLTNESGMEVVAECTNGKEVQKILEKPLSTLLYSTSIWKGWMALKLQNIYMKISVMLK